MFKESVKPFVILTAIIFLSYGIHQIIFKTAGFSTAIFHYSLNQLYLFFGLFSSAIILILMKVKEKNLDIVGNTFLLLTSVKMMVCFVFGRPIINQRNADNVLEKFNFFTLFIVFLLFETIFTIYLLNKKKVKKEQ